MKIQQLEEKYPGLRVEETTVHNARNNGSTKMFILVYPVNYNVVNIHDASVQADIHKKMDEIEQMFVGGILHTSYISKEMDTPNIRLIIMDINSLSAVR